jgi:heat shock protein HtpX
MNNIKTVVLLAFLMGILIALGYFFGGMEGATFAFFISLLFNLGVYWFSDKIVLAMYGAKEISQNQFPELFRIIQNLVFKAGLPMPRVYIIENDSPNAFATGRDPEHSAIALTTGIINIMTEAELEGVIAHELSHIKNRDTLISVVVASIAGAITYIARWASFFGMSGRDEDNRDNIFSMLLLIILAPIAALIIQLWISRTREYLADEGSAHITASPMKLANALLKLESAVKSLPMNANPSTSHLFIVNPLKDSFIVTLFSTHPPIKKRVEKLYQMASTGNF